MKGALGESGSESGSHRKLVHQADDETQTADFRAPSPVIESQPIQGLEGSAAEQSANSPAAQPDEKTIISERPVAAPEEFYRSMPLSELAAMLEGKQLDHFAVEQMIGGGGMGAVFRGRDERLDRTVAVKVIPGSKRDPETLRRFRLEAQAAARLDHPNIARVFYVGEAERWNYIVFEFIDGVNIRDLVNMEGPLSVDDAVYYARQVAEALQHAHERDVVHRDIKPSNILVTAAGIAKVVDMGLARNNSMDQSSADATASGITLGTFDYISPEQARNPRDADVRSDLYSLGCTLFYMLTGHPPFPEGTALQKLLNHGSLPPPDPRGWRDDLSDQLYAILMKLMAKQPGQRYQKPAELINDLMLLAEIEDLPRSQSPGTIMISPTVAQRTLLETNLPWMVASAFLLGSTLWLHSLQTMASGVALPEPRFSNRMRSAVSMESESSVGQPGGTPRDAAAGANRSGDARPNNADAAPRDGLNGTTVDAAQRSGRPATSDGEQDRSVDRSTPTQGDVDALGTSNGLGELPGDAAGDSPIVVSEFRPSDVPLESWESSLHRAVAKVADSGRDIELRGRLVLDSQLVLKQQTVTLRGDTTRKPSIVISAALLRSLGKQSPFLIESGSLRVVGVDLSVQIPSAETEVQELFRQRGDSELSMRKCHLTLDATADRTESFAVASCGPLLRNASEDSADTGGSSRSMVMLDDCTVRGHGSLVALRDLSGESKQLEMSIRNSLLALSGTVIDVDADDARTDTDPSQCRVYCEQSTVFAAAGFAQITYSQFLPVMLHRTSMQCYYDTFAGTEHISIRGENPTEFLDITNWLQLDGAQNGYGATASILLRGYGAESDERLVMTIEEALQDGFQAEKSSQLGLPSITQDGMPVPLEQIESIHFREQTGDLPWGQATDSVGSSL